MTFHFWQIVNVQGFSIVKTVVRVRFCQSYHIKHMQEMELNVCKNGFFQLWNYILTTKTEFCFDFI